MGATVAGVSINEAFEEAYAELGLDDTPDDGTVEEELEAEPEEDGQPEGDPDDQPEPEPEDEGEADEDAEDDDGEPEEDEEGDPEVVEIKEGATLRLPDGTEVPADKAVLFQQAFTKKTTELAEERRTLEKEREDFEGLQQQTQQTYEDMRNWYETRVANPSEWISEITLGSEDPTRTVAKAIFELAQSGKLDRKFVETFGLEDGVVAETAQEASRDDELAALRERLDAQDRTASEEAAVQQKVAEYQRQWSDIKTSQGVQFEGQQDEQAAKRELMEFAVERKLTHNLQDAYLLMQAVKQQSQTTDPEPAPTRDPATTEKKRALGAVTPRSAAGGGTARSANTAPMTSRRAALEAVAEFGQGA